MTVGGVIVAYMKRENGDAPVHPRALYIYLSVYLERTAAAYTTRARAGVTRGKGGKAGRPRTRDDLFVHRLCCTAYTRCTLLLQSLSSSGLGNVGYYISHRQIDAGDQAAGVEDGIFCNLLQLFTFCVVSQSKYIDVTYTMTSIRSDAFSGARRHGGHGAYSCQGGYVQIFCWQWHISGERRARSEYRRAMAR